MIYLAGLVAHVRVMRARHLRCTFTSLERELGDAIDGLRMIASSPAISRELWICSPRGLFRFFRLESSGLTELDRDGRPQRQMQHSRERKRAPSPGNGRHKAAARLPLRQSGRNLCNPGGQQPGTALLADASIEEGGLTGHQDEEKT